jgi:hypothetical protein
MSSPTVSAFQPSIVARHHRRDAERKALLSEQRVAAVARPEAPDLAGLREVHDVLLGVARPDDVVLGVLDRRAHRVEARDEVAVLADDLECARPHAGHDAHVHRHVCGVRQLHAHVRDR